MEQFSKLIPSNFMFLNLQLVYYTHVLTSKFFSIVVLTGRQEDAFPIPKDVKIWVPMTFKYVQIHGKEKLIKVVNQLTWNLLDFLELSRKL